MRPGAPDVVAGRFALCDPLARGATGTVWRAWDLRLRRFCAAKLLRQRDAGDALRFAREQGVRLEHPHLLTPYTWVAEDEHVLIASPLATGGSLHTLIGDYGPLAPATVADLLDQVLDGLAHVHAAGIVHRDVTPANLLLDAGPPVLRLADFGLAVRTGEPRLTVVGTVIGTPGYVPPEVLAGAGPAPAADLYAAGQVAAALLGGAEPGSGSGRLGAVVVALRAPDPRDRPASAEEARRALGVVRPAGPPATAAGEPVVVLDQLPDLPPGWNPTGPVTERRRAAAGPVPPGAPNPATPDPVEPAATGVGGRGVRRWWGAVAGAGVVVAAVVGVAVAMAGEGGRPGGGTGGGTPTPSVSVGPVADGSTCDWQREGDAVTETGGRTLTCVRTGTGDYRWEAG